jgi:hypothetical protein
MGGLNKQRSFPEIWKFCDEFNKHSLLDRDVSSKASCICQIQTLAQSKAIISV